MPSFRIMLAIGALQPGTDPATVLPTAAAAARASTTVEAYDVDVVRGQARITVRFTAADDDEADEVARRTHHAVADSAEVPTSALSRRWGARWYPVR